MRIFQPTISGSATVTGSIHVTGSLEVTDGITGSLFGTASYAATASYVLNGGGGSVDTGSFVTTSSFNNFTSSYNTGSFSGSFVGTASWAENSLTASYINPLNQNVEITGSLSVSGSATQFNTDQFYVLVDGVSILQAGQGSGVEIASADGNASFDSENRLLSDSTSLTSIDWQNRYAYNSNSTPTLNWESGLLNTNIGSTSLDWEQGKLIKSDGTTVTLDWENHYANDVNAILSIDWDKRQLLNSNSTILVDWENGTFTGSLDGTSSYTQTASYVNPLNQNVEITGSLSNGENVIASGSFSHAEGYVSQAINSYSHVEGRATRTGGVNGYLVNTIASGVVEKLFPDVTADYLAGDYLLIDDTRYANTLGIIAAKIASSSFNGSWTTVFLEDTSISTAGLAAVGNLSLGSDTWSGTEIYGDLFSHAEGASNNAIGYGSHAEGANTQAIGGNSHAEGGGTIAAALYSHAEGRNTIALGRSSHTEGLNTKTLDDYAHAEGSSSIALGIASHAEGLGTIASGSFQHVSGKYNTHGDDTSLFIIGNGVDDATRSDVFRVSDSLVEITGSLEVTQGITGSLYGTASWAENSAPAFIDNYITVGLPGSSTDYNSIKSAVDSITDASQNNTYTVRVYPGVYIEDTIAMKSWIAVKGDSSISTIVSASNPSSSVFVMADQSMVIDLQVQGSTDTNTSAIYYSSPTTPQTNAISYVENVRFGTNYTNAMCAGSGSGNCIMQCSNVKYGGYPFEIGFRVSGSGESIGRMQLRNVTSTNGGITGSADQIFALAEAPGCTFIVNGCLLTRAVGAAAGTGFKVYNGGSLRLTGVNFQRWSKGIWAPQTGSAPSIDAVALNFENCTIDVQVEHTGSTGKISGTDNFLKTIIPVTASLYEVNQDPRRITVSKKGGDFTSISASVAWITDSDANNRYVIEVGPGQYYEKEIDLTGRPYVSIVGSSIQTTQLFPSGSNQHLIKMGINNEVSFLSLTNAPAGYSALYIDDVGDYAQAHKVSFYDCDTCVTVLSSTQDTKFYGEYLDYNGVYSIGTYVSASNGFGALCSIENYYQFPLASTNLIANQVIGAGAELDLYAGAMIGEGVNDPGSIALQIESGGDAQAAGFDFPAWNKAVYIPNTGIATSSFNIVGSMIHDSITNDFDIQDVNAACRFQGTADHGKISNASTNFFWTFLDESDGELDITRNLAVTFEDGTHTDASTLIFKGSPMGVMSGGEITISGSLTINTAFGFGYLQDTIDTNVYKRIDWLDSTLTLAANSNNYIYINDNSILSAAGTSPDSTTNIILGRVVTNDTTIELIDQSPYSGEHTSNKLSKFTRDALGPIFSAGSIVTEGVTPFTLNVTQGDYFFAENNFTPSGTSSINLNQYYLSGSGWNRSTSSIVPHNVYTSGSQLISMSSSYYTKHTVYLVGDGVDEKYFLVINNNQYSSLVGAEDANLPTIPSYFNDGVTPIAAVYVQSGSANITQVQDIRPIIGFRAAGVNASSVHGNLLGLSADDHLQYIRVDGFREMTGDLGLGGNDIINVGYVSASEFRGPLANITTINATSVTASFNGNLTGTADTASYVLQAVSSSYATTSSYVLQAISASYATLAQTANTASYVLQAVSSSYATTASYASNGDGIFSGSFSGSFEGNGSGLTGITATAAPAGPDTSIQFNNGGATGGSADFTFNDTTNKLILTGSLHVTGSVDATIFTNTLKISGSSGASGNHITTQFLPNDVTNNTTGLVTAMTTTGVGPGLYQFKYVVRYQSAATTTGIGLAVDHTQASNYFVSSFWFVSTGGTAATGVADQVSAVNAGQMVEGKSERVKGTVTTTTAGVDTINADMLAVVEGLIDVSTSGDLILEFRSEVATSQVTIKSGTSLILTKMS